MGFSKYFSFFIIPIIAIQKILEILNRFYKAKHLGSLVFL